MMDTVPYFHLMNVRTPFDAISLQQLVILGDAYKLSLPLEAEPAPGIEPVPQSIMVKNGVVGLYVTADAVNQPEMSPHLPWLQGISFQDWFLKRPTL